MAGRPSKRASIAHEVLGELRKDPGVTNIWLAQRFGVHHRTIIRLIVQFRQSGLIETKLSTSRFKGSWVNRRKVTVKGSLLELPAPARPVKQLDILRQAAKAPTASNVVLSRKLKCSPSTVRRHLRVLRGNGMLESQIKREPRKGLGSCRTLKVNADPDRIQDRERFTTQLLKIVADGYVSDHVKTDIANRVARTWCDRIKPNTLWVRAGENCAEWMDRVLAQDGHSMPNSSLVLDFQRKFHKGVK